MKILVLILVATLLSSCKDYSDYNMLCSSVDPNAGEGEWTLNTYGVMAVDVVVKADSTATENVYKSNAPRHGVTEVLTTHDFSQGYNTVPCTTWLHKPQVGDTVEAVVFGIAVVNVVIDEIDTVYIEAGFDDTAYFWKSATCLDTIDVSDIALLISSEDINE